MKKYQSTLLILVMATAVLARIGAAIYLGDTVKEMPGTTDQLSYHNLALRLLGGHGFSFGENWWPATQAGEPTAHWSFLYTYYVAAVYALFGSHPLAARLIQAVIVGVVHVWATARLGRRLFSAEVGLIAAALTGVYPYFIYYSAALMTEPFYISAILISLLLAIRLGDQLSDGERAAKTVSLRSLFGISLGLAVALTVAVLLRQLFLIFIPVLCFWIWLANRRKINLKLIVPVATIGILMVAAILPFTIYNYKRFERFVLLNTNAGFAFFWANHPIYGTHFVPILPPEMGTYLGLLPVQYKGMNEAELDSQLLKDGLGFIVDDPQRYLLLSLSRIPVFFNFWPSAESDLISNISRVGGFGLLLPFMIYGLVRAFIPGPITPRFWTGAPLALLWLFMLFYTAIHVFTWTLVRYRLPVDAILMLFAGLAMWDLWQRLAVSKLFAPHRAV